MNAKAPSTHSSAVLSIASTAFENGAAIPSVYTCDGKNISPPLAISGVPAEAKTLVLIMDDPDSPTGTWDHWIVFNIPTEGTSVQTLAETVEPHGVKGNNSWGRTGYGGPCPGSGSHRYYLTVYALDIALSLTEGSSKGDVEEAMQGHSIARGELMGHYQRMKR
ncbi:MAG: hypothetical protein A3C06_04000 [Candidatus Taylorbacteria bacterium RIFCSPHIGHO2_02_FULL_46_13]|uniref:Kinase inhibitor n=1 Tax=Candidatus Taylorbacteria bacterium RIFCSPHIGHO2_02_FULL_46_13 TaxID=1802312 RepID=A0A1G2MU36_9BACT|nr:MAG: hypothetical protein A3C06_04000 [Candidatus Taylorbacteria bacterium RIFCSPHIGHO2_02_FULL_46_13]